MIEKMVLTGQGKLFLFQMNRSKGEWKVEICYCGCGYIYRKSLMENFIFVQCYLSTFWKKISRLPSFKLCAKFLFFFFIATLLSWVPDFLHFLKHFYVFIIKFWGSKFFDNSPPILLKHLEYQNGFQCSSFFHWFSQLIFRLWVKLNNFAFFLIFAGMFKIVSRITIFEFSDQSF